MRPVLTLRPCLALLAACAMATPRPVAVALTATELRVTLNTGAVCTGPAPAGAEGGWSGTLQDCPARIPYEVDISPGTNPLRLILEEVFTSLGAPDLIAPVATVTLTDATGRTRVFASPPDLRADR